MLSPFSPVLGALVPLKDCDCDRLLYWAVWVGPPSSTSKLPSSSRSQSYVVIVLFTLLLPPASKSTSSGASPLVGSAFSAALTLEAGSTRLTVIVTVSVLPLLSVTRR